MQDAQAIYQDHLDMGLRPQWQRAFDSVCAYVHFSLRIETAHAVAIIQTAQEMRKSLEAFHVSLVRLAAQACHRVCLSAAFGPPRSQHIVGRHRTCNMRSGQYAADPYAAQMDLVLAGDRWCSSCIRSNHRNAACPVISPERHKTFGKEDGG